MLKSAFKVAIDCPICGKANVAEIKRDDKTVSESADLPYVDVKMECFTSEEECPNCGASVMAMLMTRAIKGRTEKWGDQ